MSVKHSLFFTYFVQIYSAVISVVFIPLYMSRVGAEGFGLIGFFIMLQGWVQILDAGVGGSLTRQTSITKGSREAFRLFLKQFYTVCIVFFGVSFLSFILGYLSRNYIAVSWLKSELAPDVIGTSIVAMLVVLALRYLTGPFRSGLVGLEKHGILSVVVFLFVSLKFPGGLVVLSLSDNSIESYFVYQACLAALELMAVSLLFFVYSRKTLASDESTVLPSQTTSLKTLVLFSGQLSLLSILWVIVTQVDKLVLSTYLELKNFGYYAFAVSVASIIISVTAPLTQILMPRLSTLASGRNSHGYLVLYVNAFKGVAIITISLAMFMFFFGEQLVWVWSGDLQVAESTKEYIKWLAVGNSVAALLNFVFLLQYSLGKLKKHLIAYAIYCLFLIPLSIAICSYYKGIGASIFWFIHNLLFFLIWGGTVYRTFIKGGVAYLFLEIVTVVAIGSFVCMSIFKALVYFSNDRVIDFLLLGGVGVFNVAAMMFCFWFFRKHHQNKLMNLSVRW